MKMHLTIPSLDDADFSGKKVLLRLDINSPIDKKTRKIADDNRIKKSLATISELAEGKAKLCTYCTSRRHN